MRNGFSFENKVSFLIVAYVYNWFFSTILRGLPVTRVREEKSTSYQSHTTWANYTLPFTHYATDRGTTR